MRQWAEVQSPWTGDNQPVIAFAYPLQICTDVTGTPNENVQPDPNFSQLRVEAEDAVMAQIEADNDFVVVLGPEDIIEDPI